MSKNGDYDVYMSRFSTLQKSVKAIGAVSLNMTPKTNNDDPQNQLHRLRYVLHYWKLQFSRLLDALRLYADPENWRMVYGDGEQECRMWVGPGAGPHLASLAVKGSEEAESVMNFDLLDDVYRDVLDGESE